MINTIKISSVGTHKDILFIAIRGSLDTVTAYHLQEQVEALIETGQVKFLIDLKDLEHLSSAGVGLFSAIILDVQRHHGRVVFINLSEQVYEILQLTNVLEIFMIASSQEEAIVLLESP